METIPRVLLFEINGPVISFTKKEDSGSGEDAMDLVLSMLSLRYL